MLSVCLRTYALSTLSALDCCSCHVPIDQRTIPASAPAKELSESTVLEDGWHSDRRRQHVGDSRGAAEAYFELMRAVNTEQKGRIDA
jgi:hypothetical protein